MALGSASCEPAPPPTHACPGNPDIRPGHLLRCPQPALLCCATPAPCRLVVHPSSVQGYTAAGWALVGPPEAWWMLPHSGSCACALPCACSGTNSCLDATPCWLLMQVKGPACTLRTTRIRAIAGHHIAMLVWAVLVRLAALAVAQMRAYDAVLLLHQELCLPGAAAATRRQPPYFLPSACRSLRTYSDSIATWQPSAGPY